IELATQQETKEQFNDQQKPESSGQRHHSPGVDGKSLEELLGATLWPPIVELEDDALGNIKLDPAAALNPVSTG
ncbi:MAG: hypothetical protein WC000_00440, partial [Dokdonella sp.]